MAKKKCQRKDNWVAEYTVRTKYFRPPLFSRGGGDERTKMFNIKCPVVRGGRKDENFKIKCPAGHGGTKGRKKFKIKCPTEDGEVDTS